MDIEAHFPYLRGWLVSSCTAGNQPFILNYFIIEEFCKANYHKNCPFYVDGKSYNFTIKKCVENMGI